MKLSAQDTAYLVTLLNTCAIGNIDAITIEDGTVRGANPERNFAIISSVNTPRLPQKIGISRLSALRQRLDFFAGNPATTIDVKESERGEISSIDISAGRNKVQFRCTATALIKVPKSIHGEEAHRIFITKDELKTILSSIKLMSGKDVQLIIKKDRSVELKIADESNDCFSAPLETPAEFLTSDTDSVVHYYLATIFHSIVKAADMEGDILALTIGGNGVLLATINGHNAAVVPKINENAED